MQLEQRLWVLLKEWTHTKMKTPCINGVLYAFWYRYALCNVQVRLNISASSNRVAQKARVFRERVLQGGWIALFRVLFHACVHSWMCYSERGWLEVSRGGITWKGASWPWLLPSTPSASQLLWIEQFLFAVSFHQAVCAYSQPTMRGLNLLKPWPK